MKELIKGNRVAFRMSDATLSKLESLVQRARRRAFEAGNDPAQANMTSIVAGLICDAYAELVENSNRGMLPPNG